MIVVDSSSEVHNRFRLCVVPALVELSGIPAKAGTTDVCFQTEIMRCGATSTWGDSDTRRIGDDVKKQR